MTQVSLHGLPPQSSTSLPTRDLKNCCGMKLTNVVRSYASGQIMLVFNEEHLCEIRGSAEGLICPARTEPDSFGHESPGYKKVLEKL